MIVVLKYLFRRPAKTGMLTTVSWTKLRAHFVSKDEAYITHLMGTFITLTKRYPALSFF